MRTYLAGAVAALLVAGLQPAPAEGLRSLVTANDSKGWEAVGRLDIGLDGFCTGALIAPDIVLTAAHCLFDPESRESVALDQMQFLAGFRNGRATAYRKVRRAAVHPDYVYTGPEGGEHVAEDVALVMLDRPIRNSSVTPFAIARRPRKGDDVSVVSYAHNRASRPSIEESCQVLGRPAGTLVMSCDVDFGSSGAPVFAAGNGTPEIVSVISAKAELRGERVALGTRLDTILPELRARLQEESMPPVAASPMVRRPVVETSRQERAGAKFLRP